MCLTGPGRAEVVRSSEDPTEGEEVPRAKPWLPPRAGYNQHHQLLLCCQVQPSCALPGHQAHRQRCIPTLPATTPPALGSPHLLLREQTRPGQPGCCPLPGGSGCRAGAQVPTGSELCAGSSCQEHQSCWKGDGRWETLCHTPAELSIASSASWADVPVGVQSCWICLGEGVTGFVGGQGLFTVKTYNLLCPLKPNPKHRVHVDG